MRRGSVLRTLGVALVALVLTACRVDTTVDVKVLADGTGTVTVTVVADRDVLVAEPELAKELRLDDLTTTGWTIDGPTDTADGGLRVVLTHPFSNLAQGNAVLKALTGPSGVFRKPVLTAKGSRGDIHWTLAGQLDFSKGLSALADQQLLTTLGGVPWSASLALHNVAPTNAATFTLNVVLPGRPIGADGKVLPEPVPASSWTVKPGDAALNIAARTTLVSEKVVKARRLEKKVALILGAYALALVLGGIGWWKLRSRRRGGRPRPRPAVRTDRRPPTHQRPAGGTRPPTTPQNGERRPPQGRTPHGR